MDVALAQKSGDRPCCSTDSQEKFSIVGYNNTKCLHIGETDRIRDVIARSSTNLERDDRVSRITCRFSKMGKKIIRDMELFFPRSNIGEGGGFVIESIFEVGFSGRDRVVLSSRIDAGGPREFSRRSARGNGSPEQAIFHKIHQRRANFSQGWHTRGAHKRAHRFTTAKSLIGRGRGGTSAIRGAHSHRRAIASVYGRGFVFNTGLSRFAAKPGVFLPKAYL